MTVMVVIPPVIDANQGMSRFMLSGDDMYQKEAMQLQPRQYRAKIINNLFTELPNGRYELNLQDACVLQ